MSTTPAGSPQRDSAASWKRKYELLKMQSAMSNSPSAKSSRQVVTHSCLFPDGAYRVGFFSITHGQVSMGRSLRRSVDLFYSIRDLVEEGERRSRLEEDGLDVDSSEE
jgi:hypothetical protein